MLCKVSAHDQLSEVVHEVLNPHRKDTIILIPPVHEPCIAFISSHLIIRVQELLLDII